MDICNSAHVPMDGSLKLSKAVEEKSIDEKKYIRVLGVCVT